MKKKHNISVQTLPNGYSLTVDAGRYLYFDVQDLLKGFFIHAGLELTNDFDRKSIDDLVTACATWPHEGESTLVAIKLREENDQLRQRMSKMQRDMRDLKDRIYRQNAEIARLQDAAKDCKPKGYQPKGIRNPLLSTSAKLAELERQAEEHFNN